MEVATSSTLLQWEVAMSNNVKLLREFMLFERSKDALDEVLDEREREDLGQGKRYIVSGVIQRADAKNGNGRSYPRRILQREVENYQKLIRDRRAMGELDHPETRSVVELKNVSHLVTKVWWQGPDVYGKIEILNTPSGKILRELLDADVTIGISSRGMGTVRESSGVSIVDDDFQLICFDFVSDPSTTGAFMMKESRDLSKELFNKSYKINRLMNDILL